MKGGAIVKSGFKRVHLTVLSEHTVTLSIAGRNEIHIQHSQQVSLFSSHCTKCSDSRTMKSLALVMKQFVCAFFFFLIPKDNYQEADIHPCLHEVLELETMNYEYIFSNSGLPAVTLFS